MTNNVETISELLRCPLCKGPMQAVPTKSLTCLRNHTFDIAKQGYVNMMPRPSKSRYDKSLFEARHSVINESRLYEGLHDIIAEKITKHVDTVESSIVMLDAGCGEGSHLQLLKEKCGHDAILGIGLDISKDGIMMAAKRYKQSAWLVADLASSPLADQSCHVILNMLSPANYEEFKRMLTPGGLVVKVVPRPHYLKELRAAVHGNSGKRNDNNADTVSLFSEHFHMLGTVRFHVSKKLSHAELIHLKQMTPLAWNSSSERLADYMNQDDAEITVDLDILIGLNKS
ncbi:putative RNA methyltransferase [Paenibacillus septentrionalis]|uniref:RNA methyltransferase n=1 Tax=Paenibacillus septentrionalis TaxID=429342 RepID=A0ABW1V4K2_9BACL